MMAGLEARSTARLATASSSLGRACVHRAAGQAAWLRLKVEDLRDEDLLTVGAHGTMTGRKNSTLCAAYRSRRTTGVSRQQSIRPLT